MNDLSALRPIDRWAKSAHPERRCTAHRKNGEQCKNAARRGTNVCDFHGAKAPQVKAKARQRLEEAADRMAKELLGIALSAESEAVKLAAVKDGLDRAGLGAKTALELSVAEPKPYEEVLANLAGIAQISREESRARRGLPALASDDGPMEVVDAELVDDGPPTRVDPADPPCNGTEGRTAPDTSDYPSQPPQTVARDVGPTPKTPGKSLETMEDAVTASRVRPLRRSPRRA